MDLKCLFPQMYSRIISVLKLLGREMAGKDTRGEFNAKERSFLTI